MNREDIIRMAREAGYVPLPGFDFANALQEVFIERLAQAAYDAGAAAEREAAEERVTDLFADMETPYLPDIAAAIRARGQPQ